MHDHLNGVKQKNPIEAGMGAVLSRESPLSRVCFCRWDTIVVHHSKTHTAGMVPRTSAPGDPNHGLSFLVINGGCTQPKENQPISRRFVGNIFEFIDKRFAA